MFEMEPSQSPTFPRLKAAVVLIAALVIALVPPIVAAESLTHSARQSKEVQQLKLAAGKSAIIDAPVAIKRASLANPDVADAIVLTPRQIYVTGKGFGTTNLTLWGKDEQIFSVFDLDVGLDISRLQAHLRLLLPDEDNIQVTPTHDHVTLTGTVSSSARLSQVQVVAEAYAPKKVINFIKIHPENREEFPASMVVELIKGTAVTHVTPK